MMWEEGILPVYGYLTEPGDIFGCHHEGLVCSWNLVGGGQDAAKHPGVQDSPSQQSASSKCRRGG